MKDGEGENCGEKFGSKLDCSSFSEREDPKCSVCHAQQGEQPVLRSAKHFERILESWKKNTFKTSLTVYTHSHS